MTIQVSDSDSGLSMFIHDCGHPVIKHLLTIPLACSYKEISSEEMKSNSVVYYHQQDECVNGLFSFICAWNPLFKLIMLLL